MRVYNAHVEIEFFANHPDGLDQVRIVGDNQLYAYSEILSFAPLTGSVPLRQ
ncbi:hypothetical protein BH23ACT11_BH23ACT11_13120 [soil metagenome]|jgi:hypothetical protein